MGLFGFIKKAVDVVATPFAAAGAFAGNVAGIALDGAGQTLYGFGEDAVHALTFGQVGHWHNPFHYDKQQLFVAGALGSKLGEFAGGFGIKFLLPGGLLSIGAGLIFGGLTFGNPWVDKHELPFLLQNEGKLFGMMAPQNPGNVDPNKKLQIPAMCGPEGTAPDGKQYQAIAIPLQPGERPVLPVEQGPNGQQVQVGLVAPGACKVDPTTAEGKAGVGVATTTIHELEQNKGLAQALVDAQKQSGN